MKYILFYIVHDAAKYTWISDTSWNCNHIKNIQKSGHGILLARTCAEPTVGLILWIARFDDQFRWTLSGEIWGSAQFRCVKLSPIWTSGCKTKGAWDLQSNVNVHDVMGSTLKRRFTPAKEQVLVCFLNLRVAGFYELWFYNLLCKRYRSVVRKKRSICKIVLGAYFCHEKVI